MAVQAQYPSNVLLFNRGGEQERKEMDYSHLLHHQAQQQQRPTGLIVDQPSTLFLVPNVQNLGVNGSQRKQQVRDAAAAAAAGFQMVPTPMQTPPVSLFSPSVQSPAMVSLAQLQQAQSQSHQQAPPSLVSTGLRLSFDDNQQSQNQPQSQSNCSGLQQDLASLISHQKDEIQQYLVAQGEQLRRTLEERRQRHYRALLAAAEESAARRLREKELELDRAVRKAAELEDRIARLRTESLTWQAKAMADQHTAASLHAQIQQAQLSAAARRDEGGAGARAGESTSGAEDACSAHVDPDRVEDWGRACRVCCASAVSVVLLPCRHLCVCAACDAVVGESDAARCPVCHAVRTGSVQVFLS